MAVTAKQRARIEEQKVASRQARRLHIAKNAEPLIPDEVLRECTALKLPPGISTFVYAAVFEKILRNYQMREGLNGVAQ